MLETLLSLAYYEQIYGVMYERYTREIHLDSLLSCPKLSKGIPKKEAKGTTQFLLITNGMQAFS